MNAISLSIPLSIIRKLTVEAAITAFDDTIDKERAVQYPYAYGVIDRLNLPYIRFRTCEYEKDSISRLPSLPKDIPANARHGDVIEVWGIILVVLENHRDDINEMVLSPIVHVDVLL